MVWALPIADDPRKQSLVPDREKNVERNLVQPT
jgi:hypothetical protein